MANEPLLPNTSGSDDCQSSDPAYTIGYGRPPKHTRFKPGRSGNPKGRPKRQRNVRTVVEETLSERIKIREGNRTRSVTKLDGIVLTMVNGALKGDPKALGSLVNLLRSTGMADEAPEASHAEPFTADDGAVIADFMQRQSAALEPTETSEGNGEATVDTTSPHTGEQS
jgi:Family of unknown function (DUF5681)